MTRLAIRAFLKGIPWQAWAALGVALALAAAWAWHNSQITEAASDGLQKGAQLQREGDLIETIDRTEQANETRDNIQAEVRVGTGGALYDQCLRTARTPANCQRFLPRSKTHVR